MVNETNVGLASTTNDRFLMPHLPQKWPSIKVAARALNVEAFTVEVHDS